MKQILIILSLLAVLYGADFDTTTVHEVVITIEHELTHEVYIVTAVCWWKVNNQWYVKGVDGDEYWSDKPIRIVRRIR